MSKIQQLKLEECKWYAWQMFPGYVGQSSVPYSSPIFITKIEPLKTGKKVLRLTFLNALYAQGAQDFSLDMRVLKHENHYMMTELLYGSSLKNERAAVISSMEFEWLSSYCPSLWQNHRDKFEQCNNNVEKFLNLIFFRSPNSPRLSL